MKHIIGLGAIAVGVVLIFYSKVFESVEIEYFFLLASYALFLLAALHYWMRSGNFASGIKTVAGSLLFWSVATLFIIPLALILSRYLDQGIHSDLFRIAGLLFILGAFCLEAVRIASRKRFHTLRWFQAGSLGLIGSIYLAGILITPLFGTWVENNIGIGGESTFDVVTRKELRTIWPLIDEPNAEFVYPGTPGKVREFSTNVRNNSWGFHDIERSFVNPGNKKRIVVLGDNYVRALEVPREAGFPYLLESRLNGDTENFEVIRIARGGIGQKGELDLLREYGTRISPDLVILVWATNDLLDNDPELAALMVNTPGTLLFPGLLIDRLSYQWLKKRAYLLDERYRLGILRPDHWAYLEPTPAPVPRAFAKTGMLLDEILEECQKMGSDLMIVIKRPNNVLRWLNRFPGLNSYGFNPDAHTEWLSAYAGTRGIYYLDLGPYFQEYYYQHPTGHPEQYSWPHNGYWREPGHWLAAELIYNYVIENEILGKDVDSDAGTL